MTDIHSKQCDDNTRKHHYIDRLTIYNIQYDTWRLGDRHTENSQNSKKTAEYI